MYPYEHGYFLLKDDEGYVFHDEYFKSIIDIIYLKTIYTI